MSPFNEDAILQDGWHRIRLAEYKRYRATGLPMRLWKTTDCPELPSFIDMVFWRPGAFTVVRRVWCEEWGDEIRYYRKLVGEAKKEACLRHLWDVGDAPIMVWP